MTQHVKSVMAGVTWFVLGFGIVVAQESKPATPPTTQVGKPVTPPTTQVGKPVTPPIEGEKKLTDLQKTQAQIIRLQMEILELRKQLATCQQGELANNAKVFENELLKSVGAKPGQTFDWNTMSLNPVPEQPATPKP